MTCNFLTLSDDLFLLIAMEMKMEDVLRLRQTCWRLHSITKIKALWLKISRPSWIDYLNGGFSCYSTDVHDMTSEQIEAIHKICLRAESRSRSIGPQTLYKWNIPQSVDWLKIVASRWVFVAASDHSVSRLLCWDMLSISSGSSAPLAECFLPARVNSGMIEVQSEGLLVCLGLGPTPISEVQILTLRRMGTSFLFVETFTIPDCSDVQLFQGNLFVCGVFQGLQAPVLVDWRTSTVYHLFGEVPDLCEFGSIS
ncbi:hypothetical protein QCA50_010804 [Cerrena zonata]|uniref:F-box domain-containing protein n=1 Tax=Cerrena zonata TaxID=2478898 RepID=A0AAW0FY50_9APHY